MKSFKFERQTLTKGKKIIAVIYLLIFLSLVVAALLRVLGVTKGDKPDFYMVSSPPGPAVSGGVPDCGTADHCR